MITCHFMSCHFLGQINISSFFEKKWHEKIYIKVFKWENFHFYIFHRSSKSTFGANNVWLSALNSIYVCVLSSWNNNDGNEDKILTGFFLREPAKRDWSSARVFESVALWQSISLHIQSKFFKVFPQQSISLQIHLFTAKWNEFSTEKTPPREMVLTNIYFEAGGAFRVDVLSVLDESDMVLWLMVLVQRGQLDWMRSWWFPKHGYDY